MEIHQLIALVLSRRLTVLIGSSGMGKTAVASACCQYIEERYLFQDGVRFFRMSLVDSYVQFLEVLATQIVQGASEGQFVLLINILRLFCLHDFFPLTFRIDRPSSASRNVSIETTEFSILTTMSRTHTLLVFDHFEVTGDLAMRIKVFLCRLLDRCKNIKVLITSTKSLEMRSVSFEPSVIEYSMTLGPLSLISTLKLFTNLAPSMTREEKMDFISRLTPYRQRDVTIACRELNSTGSEIFALFMDGHPGSIVSMASVSTDDTIEELLSRGQRVVCEEHLRQEQLVIGISAGSVTGARADAGAEAEADMLLLNSGPSSPSRIADHSHGELKQLLVA